MGMGFSVLALGVDPQPTGRRTVMLLYEMFAIGIAVALVVAAIGGLATREMMGPEETALSRLARAAPAQRRLVASAAQQERDARAAAAQQGRDGAAAAAQRRPVAAAAPPARDARAAAAQRRLVAAAAQQERDARAAPAQRRLAAAVAQQDDWIWRCLKRQCTRSAALAASRHTHHSTRNTGR